MILRLAWRNAWRNPRRTGVVLAAVSVGIAGVVLTVGLNFGMVVQMIDTAISTDLGHLQVHAAGFEVEPSVRLRLPDGGRRVAAALDASTLVDAWARRVRGEGLASSPRASVGVRVVAIEPEREARVSIVARSITAGEYLGDDPRRILVGEELARRLAVEVGDKVVVSVQDVAGDLTGEAFRVAGLFRSPSAELDRGSVFMTLTAGQKLLGLGAAVSEIVVVARSRSEIALLHTQLRSAAPDLEVHTWEELRPVLVYLVESFDQQAAAIYAVIFVAMAFGIANVLLMSIHERVREIGVLMSIGMGRRPLVSMIVLEALVVTLVGVVLGYAIAGTAVVALGDGIDLSRFSEGLAFFGVGTQLAPVLRPQDFVLPTLIAIVTALLASIWPALQAVRLRPADAVRRA